ncbi:soluble quino protein glucose dehydrogenase [Corynespora cassiicola Philippines]|uniref:Soluble quino protein glucose dehydrogenase n=1 Tax=Corynespora cassiicola Philippines TaxID=1448308 RepID=A0A2T2N8U5_CORCC|nr:soluble quino protein glucose dehydrogenase [Corynespora cassiicola Philippines]
MMISTLATLLLHSLPLVAARSPLKTRQNEQLTEYAEVTLLDTPCETEFHPDQLDIAWVELVGTNSVLRVNVTSGEQKKFPLKNPVGLVSGMEFLPDGYLWFTEIAGNNMVRLDPKDGSMTEYPFPWTNITAIDNLPVGVRVGIDVSGHRDRGAWFTAVGLNAIGRFDIDTHEWEIHTLPNPLSAPLIIQPGPGSTMVFSELLGNRVGTIDVHTKEIKEYEIPTPLSLVQGITTDKDGLIWWTGTAGGNFGTINVTTGEVTELFVADIRAAGNSSVVGYPLSLGSSAALAFPGPIRVGNDDKVYFTMGNLVFLGNRIAQYDPKTQQLVEFQTPTSFSAPCDLNSQHPNSIFFAEITGAHLGRLDY